MWSLTHLCHIYTYVCMCVCVCVCVYTYTFYNSSSICISGEKSFQKKNSFPGGPVVNNPPANVGDMGLILGQGRSHMGQGN